MKRIISCFMITVLFLSVAVCEKYSVEAVNKSYRDSIIDAVINCNEIWNEEYGFECYFYDLNNDGKLEFIYREVPGTPNRYKMYYYDDKKLKRIPHYYLNPDGSMSDDNQNSYHSLGVKGLFYDEEDNCVTAKIAHTSPGYVGFAAAGDMFFDGEIAITEIYSANRYIDKKYYYYNGLNLPDKAEAKPQPDNADYKISKEIKKLSQSEYETLNRIKDAELLDVNYIIASFTKSKNESWDKYTIEQRRKKLEESYEGFSAKVPEIVNFEIYRADKIIKDYWDDTCSLNTNSPYRIAVESQINENGAENVEALYKSYLLACDLDDIASINEDIKSKSYFKLVLSDLLFKQESSAEFNVAMDDRVSGLNNTIAKFLFSRNKYLLKDRQNTKLTSKIRKKIKKDLNELKEFNEDYFDIIDGYNKFITSTNIFGDFLEELSTYINIKSTSRQQIAVLKSAANYTDNPDFKEALREFADAYESNALKIGDNLASKMSSECLLAIIQDTIDSIFEKNPTLLGGKLIYEGGKLLAHYLTRADETTKIFLQMSATYEIENTFRILGEKLRHSFIEDKSLANAKMFNSCYDLMLKSTDYGNKLLIDYTRVMDSAWQTKLGGIYHISGGFDEQMSNYITFKKEYITPLINKVNGIYDQYLDDYPKVWYEIYKNRLHTGGRELFLHNDKKTGLKFMISGLSNDSEVQLSASLLNNNERKSVKKSLSGYKYISAYNINLSLDSKDTSKVDNGYITIEIPLADGKTNNIEIFRIDSKGSKTAMKAQIADGVIEFKTKHLGVYAIAEKIIKTAQPMKLKAINKKVNNSKLKKSKIKISKAVKVSKAKGSVIYSKVKSGTSTKIYKKIFVKKKTGDIILQKGKYIKGTYKVMIKVTASGTSKYKKGSKKIAVKIKVN